MKIITNSASETKNFAFCFVSKLKKGDIICFKADLGGGKTTFIQGLAKGLKIKKDVASPTFVFLNIYKGPVFPLYHFDLYRVKNTADIRNFGYDEFFYGDGISAVEWSEKLKELTPKKYIEVKIKMLGGDKREIEINNVQST